MEFWDIIDRQGNLTGKKFCNGEKLRAGEYSLMVQVHLYTPAGMFLTQKRSRKKQYYPGQWDVTGGRVQAGENSRAAAVREVLEEIGICLEEQQLEKLAHFCVEEVHALQDIYAVETELAAEQCVLQEDEVESVRVVTAEEYFQILDGNKDKEYMALLRGWWHKKTSAAK